MTTRLFITFVHLLTLFLASATTPQYPWSDCQGSAKPYPVPRHAPSYPDSLTPVMINHVGRHGARYPASAKHTNTLSRALQAARTQGTITPLGLRLEALVHEVVEESAGRWGALDSLGMVEQQGLAMRMYLNYPELFNHGHVSAISSRVPRCVMSMYQFLHQLVRMQPDIDITASSGPKYNGLMRFFDGNSAYTDVVMSAEMRHAINSFTSQTVTFASLRRILGETFQMPDSAWALEAVMAEYSVLAGLSAMEMHTDIGQYLTPTEQNILWSIFNIRQYYTRTATVVSTTPADIASPLLENLIATTDAFIRDSSLTPAVNLRFGHAETLMPLLSLMRLPGCYYLTRLPETVSSHWKDFNVVPMASNLQIILFRSDTGRYYIRVDLNEVPIPLTTASPLLYTPWPKARLYLTSLLAP